jgi:DNA-binding NarL/FixJ family response regulator
LGPTRVILIDMPELQRGIIRSLVSERFRIVGEFADEDAACEALDPGGADVFIKSLDESGDTGVSRVLSHSPSARVLAVAADGTQAVLYELRPQKHMLGEISPATLLAAIQDSVDP